MVAVGALRDPEMLPKLEALLAPKDQDVSLLPSDELAVTAAWAVAKMRDPKSEALLSKLLMASSPDVRAIAAVGLGLMKNKKHAGVLVKQARAVESGPTARAAAILALGHLVTAAGLPADKDLNELVASNIDANDLMLRRAALVVSARLAAGPTAKGSAKPDSTAAKQALADGILSADPALRQDAIAAAAALVEGSFGEQAEPLPVPDGKLQARSVLAGLLPAQPSDAARTNVLVILAPQLAKAAMTAVSTSPEKAAAIADALCDGAVLSPFAAAAAKVAPEHRAKAEAATKTILAAASPGFAQLVKHPDAATRAKAAQVLAVSGSKEAAAALSKALEDGDDETKRAVLTAVGDSKTIGLEEGIAKLAKSDPSWAVRVRAAETLGKVGGGARKDEVVTVLSAVAKSDSYALVRETALRALHAVDPAAARPIAADLAKNDAEARVKETAQQLLTGTQAAATP
jgi:HEAT repeat protein